MLTRPPPSGGRLLPSDANEFSSKSRRSQASRQVTPCGDQRRRSVHRPRYAFGLAPANGPEPLDH